MIRRVLLMALKDLRLLSRDRIGMFFMLAFPVLMGVFFGSVMGGVGRSGSIELRVAVVDEDDSEMSRAFVEALTKGDGVRVQAASRQTAADLVRRGKCVAMVRIAPGFGETAGILWATPPTVELGLDPSRSAETAMLEGMVMQSVAELVGRRFQDPASMRAAFEHARQRVENDESVSPAVRPLLLTMFGSLETVFETMEQVRQQDPGDANDAGAFGGLQLADVRHVDVTRKPQPGSRSELLSRVRSKWDISFPQSMVWGVLGCVAGFATLTVRERTLGTLVRLQAAPIPRWQILAGKGVGCFIAVMVVIVFLMLVGTVLGMRPRSWPLLLMAAASTAFCFVGIMMLLSLVGKTEQATSGAAWGACTVMAMFGGGMLPLAFMPDFMRQLSRFDPVGWAVYGVEGAVWRGFSFSEMLWPCLVLVACGAVCLGVGSWLISRRTS